MATKSHHRRRNDAEIPDDVILPLAPIAPMPYAVARPGSRVGTAVKKKARAVATAIKPQAAVINKEHLLGVGANAAGGVATALLAHEFIDNVGVMPLAIGATVLGGAGSAFLGGNWQRLAQGMLGAGVSQLGTAYLTERGLKKAAAARQLAAPASGPAPASTPPAGRNAAPSWTEDDSMTRAMERAERRISAMLDEERNGYGQVIDLDPYDGSYIAG